MNTEKDQNEELNKTDVSGSLDQILKIHSTNDDIAFSKVCRTLLYNHSNHLEKLKVAMRSYELSNGKFENYKEIAIFEDGASHMLEILQNPEYLKEVFIQLNCH